MVYYRLYLIGEVYHVKRVREIEAPDDAAAIIAASRDGPADRMELWCGSRFVEDWVLALPQNHTVEQSGVTIERVTDCRPAHP